MGHFIKFKEIYRYKGFIIIKNTSHLPQAGLDKGMLGVIKSWREREEQQKPIPQFPHMPQSGWPLSHHCQGPIGRLLVLLASTLSARWLISAYELLSNHGA